MPIHTSPIPKQLTLHEQMRLNLRALTEGLGEDMSYFENRIGETRQGLSLVKEALFKQAKTLPQSLEGIDWSKTPMGVVDLSKMLKKKKPKLKIRGARYPKIMRDIDPPLRV